MASYSDFMWMAPTADLVGQARAGNPSAIRELMQRRVPATEFLGRGAPQRNMARPAGMPAGLPGLERPAYLDRGNPALQTIPNRPQMATIPAMPEAIPSRMDPTLAFGNRGRALTPAGLPGLEQPAYLGTGAPDQAPGPLQARMKPQMPAAQSEISALANGNDAAASIQRGAAQADETAGMGDATGALPEPIRALTEAFANEEDDPYEGAAADLMKEITAGINPERNKNMALAQAGFAMAASGAPYFLQGVGIGGEAGLKSYTEAQDRDTLARIRAAQIGTDLSQTRESKRSNRAGEALTASGQVETQRANVAREQQDVVEQKERERSARATEAINRGQLQISSANASTSLGNLKLAQDEFKETQRRYEEGLADAKALRKAEIEYRKAVTNSTNALDIDRGTEIIYGRDAEGKDRAYIYDKRTNKSAIIADEDGNPIEATPKASTQTAAMKNAKYYSDLGLFGSERDAAAAMLQGKSMTPERRLVQAYGLADGQLALRPELFGQAAIEERERLAQEYFSVLGGDAAPAAQGAAPIPAPQPDGAGASQYKTPDDVKRAYQNKEISKEEAAGYIRSMQAQ